MLKPHGRFVFLTPNANNWVTRIHRLVPRLIQGRLVRALYGRAERDTFPVVYAAIALRTLTALAQSAKLNPVELKTTGDPRYLAFNEGLFQLGVLIESAASSENYEHIIGDFVKRGESSC